MNPRTSRILRTVALACASIAMVGTAHAQHGGGGFHGGGGYHGGGYHGGGGRGGWHGGGWGWGGVGLGIGLGIGLADYYSYPYPYGYYDPGYVVTQPAPVIQQAPMPVQPMIYPRNGQTQQQLDSDANACSQWAGTQPNASADPSIFQRGMAACMDARGYTVR